MLSGKPLAGLIVVLLAIGAYLVVTPGGEDPSEDVNATNLAVDRATLDEWITAMPQVRRWAERASVEFGGDGATPAGFAQAMSVLQADDAFEALVKDLGFDSATHWATVTGNIIGGLTAVEMKDQEGVIRESLETSRRITANNPAVSNAEKQAALAEIDRQVADMEAAVAGFDEAFLALIRARKRDILATLQ